jgi:hypothetical protein
MEGTMTADGHTKPSPVTYESQQPSAPGFGLAVSFAEEERL